MTETNVAQVLVGDVLATSFPRHYQLKAFLDDASRLRDLARKQPLNEAERGEVATLRTRLRRADTDSVLLLIAKTKQSGGLLFF